MRKILIYFTKLIKYNSRSCRGIVFVHYKTVMDKFSLF